jgi:hypothetical protein
MHFDRPMNMMDFFRKSSGKWFIQRVVHHFDLSDDESGDSNLIIQTIEPTDPRVAETCHQQGIDPVRAMGGGVFMWQANLLDREPNPDYAAVLIDIPDDDTKMTGKLIRDRGYAENIPVISQYWFGQDGVLTIDTEYEQKQGQERCWFVNDDFRIRASNIRTIDGINLVTYCSERRCIDDDALSAAIEVNRLRATV